MGSVAESVTVEASIPYDAIPHLARPTALGHAGQLVCGRLAGVPVVVLSGRPHLYEGHSAQDVGFPVHLIRAMGARLLIASNASGGLNPEYSVGDLVAVEDHLNMTWRNPLIGSQEVTSQSVLKSVTQVYDSGLIDRAQAAARSAGFALHRGIYAAMIGPNYETRAEYRFLRMAGADLVGMSTVPETTVAGLLGLRVLAISVVTNVYAPDRLTPTAGEDVVRTAMTTASRFRQIVVGILRQEVTG